jgi:hypothetical protein
MKYELSEIIKITSGASGAAKTPLASLARAVAHSMA